MSPILDKEDMHRELFYDYENMHKQYENNKTNTGISKYDSEDIHGKLFYMDFPNIDKE